MTDTIPAAKDQTSRPPEGAVVVAGPSSSLTLPGIIASEIARSLTDFVRVVRIDVDPSSDFSSGLFRAPSLAASAAVDLQASGATRIAAPRAARDRMRFFRHIIDRSVGAVVAYTWPGLDNDWVGQIIRAGRTAGARTVVVCQSVGQPSRRTASYLAPLLGAADHVIVGDPREAAELGRALGPRGPLVTSHDGLVLRHRERSDGRHVISAFVPRGDARSLTTILSAFDAIPDSWVERYTLRVVTRVDDVDVVDLVDTSHHRRYIELIGETLSSDDLASFCDDSSALSVAVPPRESRVMAAAIDQGVGIVVMRNGAMPEVGQGYVGGLLADRNSASSVHVGLNRALRLEHLQFPRPSVWESLSKEIVDATRSDWDRAPRERR